MSGRTRLQGTPKPMHVWHGANGIRIAADSWGDPGGPLVLLMHGGGQTRHAWKGTGEFLGVTGTVSSPADSLALSGVVSPSPLRIFAAMATPIGRRTALTATT